MARSRLSNMENEMTDTTAGEGVTFGPAKGEPNSARMFVDGQQWAKVYGWDASSLKARCDALSATLAAQPSAGAQGEAWLVSRKGEVARLTFDRGVARISEECGYEVRALDVIATPAQPDTGYTDAFYQLAEMMGLPATPQSPRTVWETVMQPRLQELLDQPDTGDARQPKPEAVAITKDDVARQPAEMLSILRGQTTAEVVTVYADGCWKREPFLDVAVSQTEADYLVSIPLSELQITPDTGDVAALREGVYVASRASVPERSAMWRMHRDHGRPIISTWIDEAGEGESHDLGVLWERILAEVTTAKALILYAATNDFPLKGAFIEVGMALAAGVPVFVVLDGVDLEPRSLRPLGSWARHPLVTFAPSVTDAFRLAALSKPNALGAS